MTPACMTGKSCYVQEVAVSTSYDALDVIQLWPVAFGKASGKHALNQGPAIILKYEGCQGFKASTSWRSSCLDSS
jgi:hypothetical protein